MSMNDQIQPGDEATVEAARADFIAYQQDFEKRYGYGIGVETNSAITPDGTLKVFPVMKLVKIPEQPPITSVAPPEENQANTPPNGNQPSSEAGTSDSGQQQES